jgi:hypothetical protein
MAERLFLVQDAEGSSPSPRAARRTDVDEDSVQLTHFEDEDSWCWWIWWSPTFSGLPHQRIYTYHGTRPEMMPPNWTVAV